MHLEASDPTFIDALITPNAGRRFGLLLSRR